MGKLFLVDLEGLVYTCKHCQTHLAVADDLISKDFQCKHGKAYLFDSVVNVTVGELEKRAMISGWHTVGDIFCVSCGSLVGWKYEIAYKKSERYKEGKFIIERFKVLGPYGAGYVMTPEQEQIVESDEE